MNYLTYNLKPEEVELINETNRETKQYVCSCGIQDHKPSFCQQGPMIRSIMSECGFTFEVNENGEVERKGKCKHCGRCCSLPRHGGSPYGFYDPLGTRCKHLIMEEL